MPWLGVYGNHDLGDGDPYATCPKRRPLRRQGRHTEAEAMNREVLEARRDVLGPRHPDTLTTMNNLAITLAEQGRHAEAEAMDTSMAPLRSLCGGAAPKLVTRPRQGLPQLVLAMSCVATMATSQMPTASIFRSSSSRASSRWRRSTSRATCSPAG